MINIRHLFVWKASLVLFLPMAFTQAYPQGRLEKLDANQAIAAALANNRELQLATLDEKIAAARFRETEAIFMPQAGLSYTAMTTNNPLNAFGFKLQQQSIAQTDFDPSLLNHPKSTADFTTRVDIQQPLLNMDQYYLRKGAYKQVEASRFKSERTKDGLVFEVQKAYMQLQLAYSSVKVWEDALQTARALYRFTADRVEQGLLRKPDALNANVQVITTESNLATARSNVKNASDYLSLLMGKPYGVVYTVDDKELPVAELPVADTSLPAGRADFAALHKAIEASDLAIRSRRLSALPRLNAFGSYQLNDNRMLGFGANAYLAGIQLSWDIFKGNSIRNKVSTQTMERNKLVQELSFREEQSRLELNKAQRQLADAAYKIRQQDAAVLNASESLRILNDRYEQGLAGNTDVLMAQTQLSQQRLALAQAIFEHNVTAAYIHFLTTPSGK